MSDNSAVPSDLTIALSQWSAGQPDAADRLMPFVYEELRRIARQHLSAERSDHTLQPTALVHEAYLRLINQSGANWKNRAQFFGIAAQLMRRILIDHARAYKAAKRGGDAEHLSLDDLDISPEARAGELLALDAALQDFAAIDARKSRVVELRFFGGLTVEETAAVMSLNPATVRRDWTVAKAWLHRAIKGDNAVATSRVVDPLPL
ncbi:MAG: sigma-70 family RNA polymerase sigma factor [Verrucomicrobiota bacterium]|nr:sigma-70 family RNA polymerase sigma factor [Verrucomicrobiota bacterium]